MIKTSQQVVNLDDHRNKHRPIPPDTHVYKDDLNSDHAIFLAGRFKREAQKWTNIANELRELGL